MTSAELTIMTKAIDEYCKNHKCSECQIELWCDSCRGRFDTNPTECDGAYDYLQTHKEDIAKKDVVNHPQHYIRNGAMECINEMILVFGKEAVKNFCLCNAWKYRYRAMDKNGEEDLKKSDWYLKKYKELNTDEPIH